MSFIGKRSFFFILFIIFQLCNSAAATTQTQVNAWSTLATNDLKAMHAALTENDPALTGYATDSFNAWFNSGFQKALKMAQQVDSYAGYVTVLRYYANGFHSEHLSLQLLLMSAEYQWPGFILALRNNNYQVVYRENNNAIPPIGAKLLNCDSQSPNDWMQKNIVPYYADERIKSTWSLYVSYIFRDDGNPWYVRPSTCLFQAQNQNKTYQLYWHPIAAEDFNKLARDLPFGQKPNFDISNFGNNGVWISIPTFEPGQDKVIQTALMDIANNISHYRNKKIIVFDLRGNTGGDAAYSRLILRNLYTDKYIASLGARHIWNQPWQVAYRVSKANITYWQKAGDQTLVNRMLAALKEHQKVIFNQITILPQSLKFPSGSIQNPVTAKVFLLTDGYCDSDCWLFVREALQLPNTIQVGQPTHFMTKFTQANFILLPSKAALFAVPMQVYIEPLDHFDVPFVPHCSYSNYMGDTDALRQWILNIAAKNTC